MKPNSKSHVIRLEGPWEVRAFCLTGPQPAFQFRGTLEKAFVESAMEIERVEFFRRFNSPSGLANTDVLVWSVAISGTLQGIWLNGDSLKWARNSDGAANEWVTESFTKMLRRGQNLLECKLQPFPEFRGPFLLNSRLLIAPLANDGEFAD